MLDEKRLQWKFVFFFYTFFIFTNKTKRKINNLLQHELTKLSKQKPVIPGTSLSSSEKLPSPASSLSESASTLSVSTSISLASRDPSSSKDKRARDSSSDKLTPAPSALSAKQKKYKGNDMQLIIALLLFTNVEDNTKEYVCRFLKDSERHTHTYTHKERGG